MAQQVVNTFAKELAANEKVAFEKRVIVTTSRDYADEKDLDKATSKLLDLQAEKTFSELLTAHEEAWDKRWEKADVKIEGSDEAQQGIRFNLFQLFSTYYGDDARLNIGPKAFSFHVSNMMHCHLSSKLRCTKIIWNCLCN